MREIKWWRLLSLVILAVMWWGCAPAEARQSGHDACREDQLDSSTVNAEIHFRQHGRNYIQVSSDMTVEVPVREWSMASQLTFSAESPEYRTAMHCLLRGPDNSRRSSEWRDGNPVTTADGDKVTVAYSSYTWIKGYGDFQLGPWKIAREKKKKDKWEVILQPSTLQKARWNVMAELGGLKFKHYGRPWFADKTKAVWATQPLEHLCPVADSDRRKKPLEYLCVEVDLPWQRSLALSWDESLWKPAGIATWWVFASGVLALAALRARRPYASPAFGTPGSRWRVGGFRGGRGEGLASSVLQWALLSGAVALTLLLLIQQLEHPHVKLRWRIICIAAGLTLTLVARPWYGGSSPTAPNAGTDESDGSKGHRRRQAYAVIGFASAVAAIGMLVILGHQLFRLPPGLEAKAVPFRGKVGYVLMGLATVWLWLAAMAAWAWRFTREGGLVPARWISKWGKAPVLCVAAASALLALIAGGLLWCLHWTLENQWKRSAWLSEANLSAKHEEYVNSYLANFSFTDLTWIFTYSWLLAGIALLALLHFRFMIQRAQASHKRETIPLGPDKPDLLLIAALFALTVGMRGAKFASNNAQYGIWFALDIISLFAVLAAGRRWSVLGQMGDQFYMHAPGTNNRSELLEKAHQYRNLNHQLQLLDQGRASGVTSEQLEDQLRGLRQWLVSRCLKKNPPFQISILDVALAWGPDAHWWSNALRAARLAFCFGVPASVALLYLEMKDLYNGAQLRLEPTAIPSVVAGFIAYQTAWAGLGFVLGAVWRLLPGRRSTARAWSLAFAYAVPALLGALLNRYTDAAPKMLVLYSVLTLLILTLTSLWLDTSTLSEERQYWPSRFALLLSIHRLRGLSGQVAWLLAQVAVVVTILKELIKR
ncbi:DUF6185 family protein [Streptomyces diastatochromogenes]|uniref:DUF6185 family protein n=1 Tax=Streptomyces diastatochromogenes TaxID=42236 RepID=UPI00365CA937